MRNLTLRAKDMIWGDSTFVSLTPTRMYYLEVHPANEYVNRIHLGKALRQDFYTFVRTSQSGGAERLCEVVNGHLRFGCCRFSRRATGIIRRWALRKEHKDA